MTHDDIDQDLKQLYRSHARSVDNQAFTDALGQRLSKTRRRSILGVTPRRAGLLVLALAIVAGLVVGGLQVMQHLGGLSPILVLGEPIEPAEGEDQTDPSALSPTTVTTLASDEVGAGSVGELSGQAEESVTFATQQARDIADAVVEQFPEFRVASATETKEGLMLLVKIELSAAESGGRTVSIHVLSPVEPISEAGSTTTTLASSPGPDAPKITHPEIPGATDTYLVEYPGGVNQLIAKFPADKMINVTSVAADGSPGALLDGEQLRAMVMLVYETVLVVYPAD